MESVVVAHGLWMPGWETAILRRRLAAAGFAVRLFRYPSRALTLDACADRLLAFVDGVPGDVVHLVGHSLGGVIAVHMLERERRPARVERIGRVLCLGSPLSSSRAAARLARLPFIRDRLIGRGILDLLRRGGLPAWEQRRALGIIAGDLPVGMGALIARLPRPHDGTVAVDETELRGATDHIVLDVSHFSMLWSADVAGQAIEFLRSGRFRR